MSNPWTQLDRATHSLTYNAESTPDEQHAESTSLANPAGWLIDLLSGGMGGTHSGNRVSTASAMGLAVCYACIKIISEDVSKIPFMLMDKRGDSVFQNSSHWIAKLLRRPNHWMPPLELWRYVMYSLATEGNAYVIVPWDGRGTANELIPIHPRLVWPMSTEDGVLYYQISRNGTFEDQQIADPSMVFPARYVMHFRSLGASTILGMSPIAAARNSIDMAMSLEKHGSSLFGRGARPGGVLQHPKRLSNEQAQRLKEFWEGTFARTGGGMGSTAVLWNGVEWKPMSINSTDAQFIENRRFQNIDIAAIYRIPPTMIQNWQDGHYSNMSEGNLAYIRDALMPYLTAISQTVEHFFRIDTDDSFETAWQMEVLMRGDQKAEAEFFGRARQWGWMTGNEVRRRLRMNPIEGGEILWAPRNMQPADTLGQDLEALPAPTSTQDQQSFMARVRSRALS